MACSKSPHSPAGLTISPRSVLSSTWSVRSTRFSPRSPVSSIPAVSMNRTGPTGRSSMGFSTGSVVVPALAETMETSCLVRALRIEDLPAFRLPKMPMCSLIPLGDFIMTASFSMNGPCRRRPACRCAAGFERSSPANYCSAPGICHTDPCTCPGSGSP